MVTGDVLRVTMKREAHWCCDMGSGQLLEVANTAPDALLMCYLNVKREVDDMESRDPKGRDERAEIYKERSRIREAEEAINTTKYKLFRLVADSGTRPLNNEMLLEMLQFPEIAEAMNKARSTYGRNLREINKHIMDKVKDALIDIAVDMTMDVVAVVAGPVGSMLASAKKELSVDKIMNLGDDIETILKRAPENFARSFIFLNMALRRLDVEEANLLRRYPAGAKLLVAATPLHQCADRVRYALSHPERYVPPLRVDPRIPAVGK